MRIPRYTPALGACAALALAAAGCGSSSSGSASTGSGSGSGSASATLSGAGSTFAAPVYQEWGNRLKGQGLTINYQAVGSGAGVVALQKGTVNFAGSDPALQSTDEQGLTKGTPVQVPMFFGAITVSYNVPGVKGGLKLDGPTIADIFAKKITKWNDPKIARNNPGVKLPASGITVIHRSDSSGTTAGFTTFLSAYSPSWKSTYGADKDIKWAAGTTGASGNTGVAAALKQTQGGIAYVEQAYALQNNFTFASVKNKSGAWIAPTLASTSAAGDGITVPSDLGISTIDSPNAKAYPIASQTFVDTYKDLCKAGMSSSVAKGIKSFLDYGLGQGQSIAQQLQYAPLPSNVKSKAQQAVSGLECNGKPIG
jgi:phosphate transport system substrate-binding protein